MARLTEPSTRYHLIVAAGPEELARQAAEQIASGIDLALAERDRAQIALAGAKPPGDLQPSGRRAPALGAG